MIAMWQDDQIRFLGITYQKWGTIIFGIFYALVLGLLFYFEIMSDVVVQKFESLHSHSDRTDARATCAAALILFALFLFVTRAHERHFLPAIVFFTLIAFRSWIYWFFYALISAVYAFNMFYSYIELMPRISESAKPYLILPATSIQPFISGMVLLILVVFLAVLVDFVRSSIKPYGEGTY